MNRKTLKKNLILMLAAAGVLLAVALACHLLGKAAVKELNLLKEEIALSLGDTDIDDVEGYGILASGTGYLLGGFAYIMFEVFLVIIPGIFGMWILIFTLLAWAVAVKTGSLPVYRVLMGFDFIGAGLALLLSLSALSGETMFMLVPALGWAAVLFFGIRNTYTKRLTEDILKSDSVDNS